MPFTPLSSRIEVAQLRFLGGHLSSRRSQRAGKGIAVETPEANPLRYGQCRNGKRHRPDQPLPGGGEPVRRQHQEQNTGNHPDVVHDDGQKRFAPFQRPAQDLAQQAGGKQQQTGAKRQH